MENLNKESINKILGTVVFDKAFYFYEDIGKPTGDFAVSLSDFCNKINKVDPKSLTFHLQRGDFENWVRDIIGDAELSNKMARLKAQKRALKDNSIMREKIHAAVTDRIMTLQDMWQQALKWPQTEDNPLRLSRLR